MAAMEFIMKCLLTGFVLFVAYRTLFPDKGSGARILAVLERHPPSRKALWKSIATTERSALSSEWSRRRDGRFHCLYLAVLSLLILQK
jgi:hypothetical protein